MSKANPKMPVFARVKAAFAPPRYPDDAEKTRLANRLHTVSWIGIALTLIYTVLWFIFQPALRFRALSTSPSVIVFAIVLILIRYNRIRAAIHFVLAGLWVVITFVTLTAGGTRSPFFGFYILLVMSAVLFAGWRIALAYGVLVAATSLFMVYLANIGLIAEPFATPGSAWMTHMGIMLFVAIDGYIIVRDIQMALKQSQDALAKREQAQAALSESEERFRLISSFTTDYSYSSLVNDRGELEHILLSGAFERITGYTPEEYRLKGGWRSLVHPDDRVQDNQAMGVLHENRPVVTEVRIVKKDGEIRWVRVYAYPVWDAEKNRLVRINGAVQDITARRQAEAAILALNHELSEKAAQLTTLNEIARDISAITDLSTTLKRVLTKLQAILPLDAFFVALYDAPTQTVKFPILYDDGQFWELEPEHLEQASKTAQVLQTGEPVLINRTCAEIEQNNEIDYRLGDVKRVSASIMMAPLPIGETNIGVISVQSYTLNSYDEHHLDLLTSAGYQIAIAVENARLYDSLRVELAERKRLEKELQEYANQLEVVVDERTNALRRTKEQLELVLNNTTNALAFADQSGDILIANPAFRETFAERVTQSIEFILWSVTNDDQISVLGDALLKVIYDARIQQVEVRIISKGGAEKDIELTFIPVPLSDHDSRHGVLVSGHDITQLKAVERFKERFVADAVHDLATPIAGLSTRLYLLQRTPENMGDHVRALENQVEHLKNLLDDLRTLSQIDRGQVALDMKFCNINTLMQRVFDIYEPVALEKEQTIELRLRPALPFARVDQRHLERVLVNLVSNAVNYTPAHKTIRLETTLEENNVVIHIADEGIGISPDDLSHIFERFFRTTEARTHLPSGTGLGLAITKEIIELHGGTISVSSELDQGTCFTVRLPLPF